MSFSIIGVSGFLRRLPTYLRPYRIQSVLILLGLLVDLIFDTAFRLSFKFVVDDALVPRNRMLLLGILGGLAGGVVIASLSSVGRDYLYARLSASILNDLRLKMFSHLQRLPISFYSRTQVGEIMARFSTDLSAVENTLVLALPAGAISLMGILFAAIPLFVLEWRLALLAFLGLTLCLVGPRLLEHRASMASYQLKEEQARIASTIRRIFKGVGQIWGIFWEGRLNGTL